MISSLPKNRGLRLQLLVALLLVFGSVPEPSEGLKCYVCDTGVNKDDDCKQIKDCQEGSGHCQTRVTTAKPNPTFTHKSCMQNHVADCIMKAYGPGCVGSNETVKALEIESKVTACTVNPGGGSSREEQETTTNTNGLNEFKFSHCLCDKDHCNGDGIPASSGGHLTSAIIITFLALVVASYNCI